MAGLVNPLLLVIIGGSPSLVASSVLVVVVEFQKARVHKRGPF
jgi:hypothetical protein